MAKHLRISGRVQGVGFRYSMQQEARRLGVTGWVRNCRDGTVEAVVDGAGEAVEALVNWARLGPPAAQVQDVCITETTGSFPQFELRPTARSSPAHPVVECTEATRSGPPAVHECGAHPVAIAPTVAR